MIELLSPTNDRHLHRGADLRRQQRSTTGFRSRGPELSKFILILAKLWHGSSVALVSSISVLDFFPSSAIARSPTTSSYGKGAKLQDSEN